MRTARDIEQFEAHRPAAEVLRVVTLGADGAGRSTLVERLDAASRASEGSTAGAPPASSFLPGRPGNRAGTPPSAAAGAARGTGLAHNLTFRVVATSGRACLIADGPGDEPDTRRLVTSASAADVALVVIDATLGLDTDARRHTYIASLLGVRRVALVVNKLDLAGYAADVFDRLRADYTAFGREIGLTEIVSIPICALHGDNVAARSANTPWHDGPTVLGFLETVPADAARRGPFRMFVRDVSRSSDAPAAVSGPIVGGTVRTGDRVRVLPSARESVVNGVTAPNGALQEAAAGSTVTLALADALDVSPGDLVAAASAPPELGDQFEASVIWMSDAPMLPGRPYAMTIGATTVGATITKPKHKVHVDTLDRLAARTLETGDIGVCNLHVDRMIPFDPHGENRQTGGFVLIDPLTQETIGAGVLHFALRRSQNIHWQAIEVDKGAHAALNGHRPCIVWFTGLSGAGKSTIANIVERKLHAMGRHTFLLDGDNVRHGLNKDLGFTEADRVENIRRVAEVARLMVDAGLIVLVSFISPFRAERRLARSLVADDEFCEVFVDAPLAVAEARDRKGLYKKARRGELKNFTGIDSPYEPPENPELRLDTSAMAAEAAADLVVAYLDQMIRASGRD